MQAILQKKVKKIGTHSPCVLNIISFFYFLAKRSVDQLDIVNPQCLSRRANVGGSAGG